MRRSLVALLVVLGACTSTPSVSSSSTVAITTVPTPATTTTSLPGTSTTGVSTTTTTLAPLQSLAYDEVARIDFPIQMVPWSAFDLIATKDGRVWLFESTAGEVSEEAVLDIRDQVRNDGEQGLLSITVHPSDTNRLFVHYSANDGNTVVSEFRYDGGGAWLDEQVLLRLNQPARNHNGGMLQFGPDGSLYLGLGDGGGANDRFGNGQNTNTLLGGLVRIDVDDPDAEPELFQYGLRNPWRFWIDDDLVYIADVGQNTYEEINVAGLEQGLNYGWPITEALRCFSPSSGCDTEGLTLPVVEVEHGDSGTCSITGGVVYRGAAIPEIDGHYFYSDYCGGYLRSLVYEDGEMVEETDWTDQVGVAGSVASFGVDSSGEMYVLTTEAILRVIGVR